MLEQWQETNVALFLYAFEDILVRVETLNICISVRQPFLFFFKDSVVKWEQSKNDMICERLASSEAVSREEWEKLLLNLTLHLYFYNKFMVFVYLSIIGTL